VTKQTPHQTKDRSLILTISTSFGEMLISGGYVCIGEKTMLKQREKYVSENSMRAQDLEGQYPKAIQPKKPSITPPTNQRLADGFKSP
jgi:hypothetical protein